MGLWYSSVPSSWGRVGHQLSNPRWTWQMAWSYKFLCKVYGTVLCLDYEAEFILLCQLVPRHLPLQWCLWVLCVFSACASLSKLLVSMHLIRGLITAILLKWRMWASTWPTNEGLNYTESATHLASFRLGSHHESVEKYNFLLLFRKSPIIC